MRTYEHYKDSGIDWIGQIPAHWEVKKLKYLCNIYTGYTPLTDNKNNFSEDGIIWVKPDNLQGLNYVFDSKEKVSRNAIRGNFLIPKDSILLCSIGTIGKMAIAGDNLITNQQINSLVFHKNIDKSFSKYLIYNSEKVFDRFSNGNVVKIINTSTQKEISFVFPPIHEQEAIANFLDEKTAKIDELVQTKEQQIEKLKELRQVVIHEAVTKGIQPNVELKASGIDWIGEIPSHWEVRRLANSFSLGKGLTITKEYLRDEGVFCLNYGEIHSKYGFEVNPEIHQLRCVDEDYLKTSSSSLLEKGDFVFADTSEDLKGSGNFTYLSSNIKTFAGYHTVIARPNKDLNSRFLAYEFDSAKFRSQIQSKVKGVKVFSITQTLLKTLFIWLPQIQEQEQIVAYLDEVTGKIDQAIAQKQEQITKLKEYKQSLINDVVTGKVKVC